MVDRQRIAQLVDELNHPDPDARRERMQTLIEMGREAVPALTNNLRLVEPEVRQPLVRVLGDIGDDRALLPLMRYIFDTQGEPEESDARGLAMQAIMNIAEPRHTGKLFDFLIDMKDDDDPFVRGYVIEAFGRLGDERAEPFIDEGLEDDDEFVRERSERAQKALERSEETSGRADLSEQQLLQKLRISSDSELEYYINELLRRDDAFEIATRLVREEGRDTLRGLRCLQKLDDPRVREVAREQYERTTSDSARAVCLRLLADHLDGDATDRECQLIRKGLRSRDPFIELAALEAAGTSGRDELVQQAIDAVDSNDSNRAVTAARALARGMHPDQQRRLPDLIDVFYPIHRRRVGASPEEMKDDELVRIEAYLIRAIYRVVSDGGMGVDDARDAALTALEHASSHRPVLVTSLSLLDGILPEQGLDPAMRWAGPEVQPLLDLLEHPDDEVTDRVLNVVDRGVAGEVPGLSEQLSRLIYSDADTLLEQVIPLLERAGDSSAIDLLEALTEHTDDEVRETAESTRRRLRNRQDVIDVDYDEADSNR